jgi:IS5 family transposase
LQKGELVIPFDEGHEGTGMAHRKVGQLSLADAVVAKRAGNRMLERVAALIDWAAVESLLSGLHAAERGAPSYPPLVMFKAILLQQWHALSDPELEAALADRISFRSFCGLALDDDTPDHVTIHRFRNALRGGALDERLFAEIMRQIDARGLVLRRGTLIDASLVAAAVKRPKPPQDPQPEGPDGRAPSKLVKSERDPDASWTKKGGKRHFGYKAHVGVDQGSGLIRRAILTGAAVNDTVPADGLVLGDEAAVYADQAYDKHARRAALAAKGIKPRLMFRPSKHHKLTERQKRFNGAVGRRRAPVEQVFARLKGAYGWARVRYLGLGRNETHLRLLCLAMNLKRMVVLCRTPAAA